MIMEELKQYLDLYRNHRDLICGGSAAPLNALRERALEVLERKGLPKKGSEDFENIDFAKIISPDFGLNLDRLNIDVNPAVTFRCDVPVLSSEPFLNVNDTFAVAETGRCLDLPDGVEVGSLRKWALENPEEVSRYYGRLADIENPLVALDTLFAQDGMYLRVNRGVRIKQPLQLVNILSNGMPLMAVRRLLVIVGEDAEVQLIACDHTQIDDIQFLSLQTIEMFAGRNSRLGYYDLEESTAKTSRLSTLWLRQEEGSDVTINSMTLYNGTTRNEFYCRFAGEHASLRLSGMGIEDEDRTLSTYSRISHDSPRCHSNELFKYTVDDRSTAAFSGKIYVAEGSVQTEAYQANRNLVSGNEARIYTKPVLEIYNDDVKCSHGAAIGQLDEMQLFYMRTRGLSEETARLILRQAFMADVIDAIAVPALRDRLHLLVERRYSGASSACASCRNCDNLK